MVNPRLSRAEWTDLTAAAPRLLLVWTLLPIAGIARTRRWTCRTVPKGRATKPFGPETWRRRAIALKRIGARLPGCRCLARSIALSAWLTRHGHPNQLHIGITGTHATLRSHSWVESHGRILDDTPENICQFRQITEI